MFGREPNLWINTIAAALAVAVGFGFSGLTDGRAAAITAALTAVAAAWTALRVRPVGPAAFGGVITTGAALLASFGLELSQQQVGLISAGAITLMALITRAQVTPAADPRVGVGLTSRG